MPEREPGGDPRTVGMRHMSLPEAIADELRERIIEGVLPTGARLVERELAEQLQVSRIPMREAIVQLEVEGLVRRLPRRGAMVSTLTSADVTDLFDVHESLDALAAGLAAERADETNLALLRRHVDQATEAAAAGQTAQLAKINVAFHIAVVTASGSPLLSSAMRQVHGRLQLLFRLTSSVSSDPTLVCAEHVQIFTAIASGNRAEAERLARAHAVKNRESTLAIVRELESSSPQTPDRDGG